MNLENLSKKAQVTFLIGISYRIFTVLDLDITHWFKDAWKSIWHWLSNEQSITSHKFYSDYIKEQVPEYLGFYDVNTKEADALIFGIKILYFTCRQIGKVHLLNNDRIEFDPFPFDISYLEDDIEVFETCIKLSLSLAINIADEKLLHEKIFNKLSQDFYTEDESEIGPLISRDYFEGIV